MNKKLKEFLEIIRIPITIFIIAFFVFSPVYLLSIASRNDIIRAECDKYKEEYNIMTEIEGKENFWSWGESYKCKILMEDGTKVDLRDFNIATIKKPMESKK